MKNMNFFIFIITICLMSFFSGCASFRAGNLPPSEWSPESVAQNQSIDVIVSGESIVNGKEQDPNAKCLETWNEQVLKAYNDSGLFSEVKTGIAETDLRSEVKILDRGEVNLGLAFITGLTLYLIPSKASDEITIQTKIKDREGKILGTFEKSETINTWQQLFLIFGTPFNFPGTVTKETLYDLNRAIINEAHMQGVI
jgi:hypothetical protein